MRVSLRIVALLLIVAPAASCGDLARTGRSPVQLVINQLQAAAGPRGGTFASPFSSSVVTVITSPDPCTTASPCFVVTNDLGQAILSTQSKNPTLTPSTVNNVTIDRVHVEYIRADGHNTPGVDVPFPFDGAATATIPAGGSVTISFEIVRIAAKEESPLVQLVSNGGSGNVGPRVITTITQVTFYGHDQAGNELSVMGQIQIDFGNFSIS